MCTLIGSRRIGSFLSAREYFWVHFIRLLSILLRLTVSPCFKLWWIQLAAEHHCDHRLSCYKCDFQRCFNAAIQFSHLVVVGYHIQPIFVTRHNPMEKWSIVVYLKRKYNSNEDFSSFFPLSFYLFIYLYFLVITVNQIFFTFLNYFKYWMII